MADAMEAPDERFIERDTLCIAGPEAGVAVHAGEAAFSDQLRKHYQSAESNVAQRLIDFKVELKGLESEAFWSRLMEGMTEICGAQFGFVSKRILVDDDKAPIEMPPIGEVGSCLMGVALYFNDGKGIKGMNRDYKYFAWSAPCAYMRHDKVFLIPENLTSFITENPNQLPFECSAYLGVPLFAEGKCFAHFGMMWTDEGLILKKDLSWSYIEMFMHSLEDMVAERLLSGHSFAQPPSNKTADASITTKVIPQSAITATQSLKPYARSLSHELRTPMQGIVGMLDVMYTTVQEQIEGYSNSKVRAIFQTLKDSIEVVQDSSKRAIEAADNVVHAYDLNMQIPETPSHDVDSPATQTGAQISSYFDARPNMGDGSKIWHSNKRKLSYEPEWNIGSANKKRDTKAASSRDHPADLPHSPTSGVTPTARKSPRTKSPPLFTPEGPGSISILANPSVLTPSEADTNISTPALRQCFVRDAISVTIQESLRVGGRPDSAVSTPMDNGERIEVRSRSSNGHASQKTIEWTVDPTVPDVLPVDERDFSKLISAVFLNAIKFTEDGNITLRAQLSPSQKAVLVNVADTGIGIPEAFQPELFKPFSKEDDSLTRTKEGLGLGLLVAKGLARRIGGDITLLSSNVGGPNRGSEFEIRLPLDLGEPLSRANTPFHTEAAPPRSTPATSAPPSRQQVDKPFGQPRTPPEPVSPTRTYTPGAGAVANVLASAERMKSSMLRRTSATPRATPLADPDRPDRQLAEKYPLTFLVAEDNKINRKLLVSMLNKLGYKNVYEAFDGKEAVRVVDKLVKEREQSKRRNSHPDKAVVDVVLMDLWMPEMDGYQATETILGMFKGSTASSKLGTPPTVLAVSADVTDTAIERATTVGMLGYMSKPYKLLDLQKLIMEFCVKV